MKGLQNPFCCSCSVVHTLIRNSVQSLALAFSIVCSLEIEQMHQGLPMARLGQSSGCLYFHHLHVPQFLTRYLGIIHILDAISMSTDFLLANPFRFGGTHRYVVFQEYPRATTYQKPPHRILRRVKRLLYLLLGALTYLCLSPDPALNSGVQIQEFRPLNSIFKELFSFKHKFGKAGFMMPVTLEPSGVDRCVEKVSSQKKSILELYYDKTSPLPKCNI